MNMKQEKIWQYYQGEGVRNFDGAKHRLYRLFLLVKKYKKKSKINILNIGVGNAYFEELCVNSGLNIHSLDIDKNIKEKLTKSGVNVHIGSIDSIPIDDNYFDFIICSEVIEHLTNKQLKNGIAELYRVLKVNGYIIGTVPYNEKLFENQTVCPNCNHKYHRWGHWQSFDREEINKTFSAQNFTSIKTRIIVFKDFTEKSFLNYIKYLIRYIISIFDPSFVYSNILFVIKK